MLQFSLKRKKPEISTNIADRARVFSKSARVGEPTGAETTRGQKKNPLAFREICSSLLRKISSDPIDSGSFGTVYIAEYRGIKTAVKEMKKRSDSADETERCRREVSHEA